MSKPVSNLLQHKARKRFGQNFLNDERIIDAIIQHIHPKPEDNIVEIGPGLGALTVPLLEATNGKLNVVELDRDLAEKLRIRFASQAQLTITQADALKFDFSALVSNEKLRVLGNLPYNISTPLLFHLIAHIDGIKDMHFMLQKELVDRITAVPNSKAWGRLSVMMQYYCKAKSILQVPPSAFKPAPKVQSAVVKLVPRPSEEKTAKDEQHFAELVRRAFSLRRKTLKNCLAGFAEETHFSTSNINPSARAETLQLEDFIRLSNVIHQHS